MPTNSEFDKTRFPRHQKVRLFNFEAYISSPEGTILQKYTGPNFQGEASG